MALDRVNLQALTLLMRLLVSKYFIIEWFALMMISTTKFEIKI